MHPTMDLERDLGIDSIKRVEILAELRKRVPELAGVKPAALVARRTLADIAQFLNGGAGEGGEAAPVRAAASSDHAAVAVSASAPCAAAPAGDPVDLLRAVISEKTGFPTELIQPEMDLQQDLGVDSIKRIEVLVALRSLVPALAGVQPADLAPLKTVSQVAAFVSRRSAN
jgi:acyl carrier protein